MSDELLADEKRMRLRYAGTCRVCEVDLPARVEAIYERSTKTVRCLTHDDANATSGAAIPADPIDIGTPGASARREFERRKAGRERRVRAKHPKIGGFLQAISDEPQSTTAWTRAQWARSGSATASTSWPLIVFLSCMIGAFLGPGPTSITSP